MKREIKGRKRPIMDRSKGKSREVGEEYPKRRGKIQKKREGRETDSKGRRAIEDATKEERTW